MTRRRRKGTGTIERTVDGRFRARFAFDGQRREDVDGSPFATYDEASDALDGILAALAAQPVTGMSVAKLGERTLDHREREGYRSVDSERTRWEFYFGTWDLATMPARAITRGDVRERMAELAARGLAAQTRRNVLNLLRAVFAFGVDGGQLETNPCDGVRVKDRGTTRERSTVLTRAEVDALLEAATDPAVAIAVGTGMRSGELRSLRWEDVVLTGARPHIVVRYGKPEEPTKNGKIRTVPLFGVALAAARTMKKSATGGIVFPSASGWYRQRGRVVEPAAWAEWKAAAGIVRRVRFHDLRHTAATLLLTGGWGGPTWSYEEVKDMLGHSSVKVTERYARSTSLATRAALAMKRPRSHKPKTSPTVGAAERAKAREILERRGSDSNRRMTVLQTGHSGNDLALLPDVSGLARAYVEAVESGDPFAIERGLDLADAVWLVAPVRAEAAS